MNIQETKLKLRSTQKPLPKERKDYFFEKLEKRGEKISELTKMDGV